MFGYRLARRFDGRCHTGSGTGGLTNTMIGLVIVTHGRLAEEFRAAMEHVVGHQRNVETVCIGADDDCEARRFDVQNVVNKVDSGDGVIVVTDMFGGTPSNLCISQLARPGVEVLAGANLPMLVKLAKIRSTVKLADAAEMAQAAGRKYIARASEVPSCRVHEGPAVAALAPACGCANGTGHV